MAITHATITGGPAVPGKIAGPEWDAAHVGNGFGWLNVMDRGAVGNGVADDTTVVQDAIDDAFVVGGGVVFIPPDTTLLVTGLQLKANVELVGSGYSSVIKLANAANEHIILVVGDQSACRNFRIDGNKANQTEGSFSYGIVSDTGIDDVTVEGMWIFDVLRSGIYLDGLRHRVHGNTIKRNGIAGGAGRTGIAVLNSTGTTTIGAWHRVSDNYVEDSSEHGIKVYDNCDHTVVSGNTVVSVGEYGIYCQVAENVVIANNTVDESVQPGIILQDGANNCTVSNNTIKSSASHGILVWSCNDVVVSGNAVWDCGDQGMYILSSPNCAISGNVIVNNGGAAGGAAGIMMNGSPNCSITGNVLRNNGSTNAAWYGMGIFAWGTASDGTVVTGNRAFDNGTGKQEHGIQTDSPNTAWVVVGNNFAGNSVAGTSLAGTNTVANNG